MFHITKKVVTNNLQQQPGSDVEQELEKYRLLVAAQQRHAAEYKQSAAYQVKQDNDARWAFDK